MIIRNSLIIGLIATALFACSEKSAPEENEKVVATSNADEQDEKGDEDSEVKKAYYEVLSFNSKSKFTITTKNAGLNKNTGTDNVDIYLNNKLLKSPIKLTQELSYSEVNKENYEDIPNNAVFAFSTWFAGGGAIIYGVVKDGVLKIYRKFEDEGEESQAFTLYREIDPNVQTKKPDYYIAYDSDTKSSKGMMISFSKNGKAQFVKYAGQSRQIELRFVKEVNEERNFMDFYDEIVDGEVNGTYKLTHSGNWDYAEYTPKNSTKKYTFTINHVATIVGDTYRTEPSL